MGQRTNQHLLCMAGWGQYAIRNGSRQDAANTYLEPASNWDNLDVLINTQVTKVLKIGEESGVPVIRGVQFALNSTSESVVCLEM